MWTERAMRTALATVAFAVITGAAGCNDTAPTAPSDTTDPAPTPIATSTAPASSTTDPAPSDRRWANCAEAKAAGKAPMTRGERGYRADLDANKDGVACE